MTIEQIKEKLIAQGMQPDELETLFKSDEALIAYYRAQEAAKSVDVPDDDSEPEPEDDYRLSPADEQRTLAAEKSLHVEESRKRFDEAKQKREEAEEQMPESERTEEPVEKVDFEDFMKSIEDGFSADDSDIPNN